MSRSCGHWLTLQIAQPYIVDNPPAFFKDKKPQITDQTPRILPPSAPSPWPRSIILQELGHAVGDGLAQTQAVGQAS